MGDLGVALDREQQGHVDRDAGSRQLAKRINPRDRAGNLDHRVRSIDRDMQFLGALDRVSRIEGKVGLDLNRDKAVGTIGAVEDGAHHIARSLDVLNPERLEDLCSRGIGGEGADRLVIGAGLLNVLGKNRRVRGTTGHAILFDDARQQTRLNGGASHVVVPDALSELSNLKPLTCHGVLHVAVPA